MPRQIAPFPLLPLSLVPRPTPHHLLLLLTPLCCACPPCLCPCFLISFFFSLVHGMEGRIRKPLFSLIAPVVPVSQSKVHRYTDASFIILPSLSYSIGRTKDRANGFVP
ncbi:MAG: hypothetical protein JOS17DRAFT_762928 [Linnemannia elongata]|nr:MAG: hypothetical protein JOS17DRAFT_762928 [Linnemannia elongata]